jgi:hypothetical protein
MNKLLLITILLAMLSCKGEDCETLPTTIASYSESTSEKLPEVTPVSFLDDEEDDLPF